MNININGIAYTIDENEKYGVLLDYLRQKLSLMGTRYGCGVGQCGACTVLVDGKAVRTCLTPLLAVEGKKITTIEGLADMWDGDGLHPVQQAFYDEQVPQCGFCMSGQMMSVAALLLDKPDPTDSEIDRAMSGNICRCGTYPRIRKALKRLKGVYGS